MRLLLLFIPLNVFAASAFDTNHRAWDKILHAQVRVTGSVTTFNYKAVKSDPKGLENYLKSVGDVSFSELQKWGEKDRLAFLINAYNAFTVKLIVDNYPVKSINDLGSPTESPWKKKFFKLFGETTYLDHIEHDLIRAKFSEPRIHFAVVCASKGCPSLRNEAYTARKLEEQLEAGAKSFLNDRGRNRYDPARNKLFLSKIFDWYGDDFKKKDGSVQNFVAPRMGKTSDEQTKIKSATLEWNDYDWSLNETVGEFSASQ